MSRTDLFWAAAAATLSCLGPSVVAAASLEAAGVASAGAHLMSDPGDIVQTPGPGSLTVTIGAASSDAPLVLP